MRRREMGYDLPEWLKNPHPEGTEKWWNREWFIWEAVNDCGAAFDAAGNRTRKGEYSDIADAVRYFRAALEDGDTRV
jgi:hypothetical protein